MSVSIQYSSLRDVGAECKRVATWRGSESRPALDQFFFLFFLSLLSLHPRGEEEGQKTRQPESVESIHFSIVMTSSNPLTKDTVPPLFRNSFTKINGSPASVLHDHEQQTAIADAVLELGDGSTYRGIGFGAEGKSVAGECVFQTGESVDDRD